MSAPLARGALTQLQELLQSLHGVAAQPAADFLVSAAEKERLCPGAAPHEALLVSEEGEELRIGLYLDDEVLRGLTIPHTAPWTATRLQAFCHAAEGLSHYLYLCFCAVQGRRVSLLELEAQAEVDKYLCVVLQLWATGRRAASGRLRELLFDRARLREGLTGSERERYQTASALGGSAARSLEVRFVREGRLEGLLREARRLYRLAGPDKLSAFNRP